MPQLEDIIKKKAFKKKDYRSYDVNAELQNKDLVSNDATSKQAADKDVSQSIDVHKKKAVSKESRGDTHNSTYKLIEIETSKCRPWAFADRSSLEMGNIEELANSIKANGQQEPVLVRKLKDSEDEDIEYEVIFGHRRWLACTLCNKPLLAILKDLNDQEAAIAQKEENENRENLSDYARAFNYQMLLDKKVFSNESALAAHFNISRATLGDLMSYTRLPDILLSAIDEPHLLPKRTAVKLAQLCKNISKENIGKLSQMMPSILAGRIPFKALNKDLFEVTSARENRQKKEVKQFKNTYAVNLFSSGLNQNRAPCFTFHKIVTDNNLLSEIEELVYNYLKEKTES